MKITHIIIGLGVGGAELMLKRLVEGLNGKDGMHHTVISLTDLGPIGQQLQDAGISVTALCMKNVLSLPSIFFKLRRELKRQKPDIVHTWMYRADFLGGLAARSIGINKVIWSVRNTYLDDRGRLKFIFRKICAYLSNAIPKKIIFVSYSAQREHLKAGYSSERGVVIGNGFDTDKFLFSEDKREKYRSEMKLDFDDIAVFSVGRCDPAKDHLTFIKAICEASKYNNKIKGVLVGRDIDLDNFYLSDTEKEFFILLGQKEDIAGLLSAADIFCLHSITEGFPNVLGEAMSVGLPCIATKAGDAELILSDNNYTVDIGDFLSIGKLIINLSTDISGYKEKIGKENREKIIKSFSLETVLDKYLINYEKLTHAHDK